MKILKAYKDESLRPPLPYTGDCPLLRELHKLYDVTELTLPLDYTEEEYANIIRDYDVLLTMWYSPHIPNELAQNPGKLKYICNISGSVKGYIDKEIIESPYLTVTNWGDASSYSVAEGAVSLLMTMLKDIPLFISHARDNKPRPDYDTRRVGTLYKTKVGIYGMGFIGRKFVEYIRAFMPDIYAFDPYVDDMPDGVTKVNSLEELFSISQVVAIHAGLNDQTKGTVTKELLAMLPDGAVLINTARGAIIDEKALIAEVMSGRIRAGLDVMIRHLDENDPEPDTEDMPALNDPVRMVDNAVFTGHTISNSEWSNDPEKLDFPALNCLENLARFQKGEPLKFVIDIDRYKKIT